MMKFCRKCGSEMEEGIRFCKKCGAPAEDGPTTRLKGPAAGKREGGAGIKKWIAVSALVLEILQLLFYFLPVFTMEVARYGERESITVRQVLYEVDWGGMDVDQAVNMVTGLAIGLSVLAVLFTLLIMFQVQKGKLAGHIFRFLSWGYITLLYVDMGRCVKELGVLIGEERGLVVRAGNSMLGNIYGAICGVLFLQLVFLVVSGRKKQPEKKEMVPVNQLEKKEMVPVKQPEKKIEESPEEELQRLVHAVQKMESRIAEIRHQMEEEAKAALAARAKEEEERAAAKAQEVEGNGFCFKCGAPLMAEAAFCAKCGAKVERIE